MFHDQSGLSRRKTCVTLARLTPRWRAKSGQNITKVDLNLSFQFDLQDSQKLSAGRYIFIKRKDAAAKNWVLR